MPEWALHIRVSGKISLAELKRILGQAYLTISTDSGPMRISAVERTPTTGIFGVTNWVRAAPYGPWSMVAYDHMLYPDGVPPAKTIQVPGDYYQRIDVEKALSEISDFL